MKSDTLIVVVVVVAALVLVLAPLSDGQSAGDNSPLICNASVHPTKVHPGDTMVVTAEVSDSSGIKSVTANMGGIETISLSLVEGSIYHGTWQGQWLVHDTRARDYVTTIRATNSQGKSSSTDIIWRDPQTYERYHKEYLPEQTTIDTNWVDALTMTFTPNVAGNFYVHVSATLMNSSTATYTEVQAIYNSTVINTTRFTPVATTDNWTFGAHNVTSLSATPYTFKIQYRTGDVAGTASIRDCRMSFFAVSDYQHAADDTESSTSNETYDDKLTLTFAPLTTGDYLVIGSMEIAGDAANRSVVGNLTCDGVSWGEINREPTVASEYQMFLLYRKQNLSATSHTFKIQYMSEAGAGSSTTYIRRARITAIRLTDLGDAEYAESEAEESTTSTTYQLKGSLSWDHATYENCFRLMLRLIGGDNIAKNSYSAWFEEGVQAGERSIKPNADADRVPLWGGIWRYHSSAAHTFEHKYKTESPATAYAKNVRLIVIRADTLNPFSDSGRTTYCNNFNSMSLSTVYIQGCYFEPNHNFHVAYYDGGPAHDGINGVKVLSDGGAISDANGVLNSQWYFPDNQSASYGTWHAMVYDDDVGSPPPTYVADNVTSIRECSFYVDQAAIPEFPTLRVSIALAVMCFVLYYWMRRRLRSNHA